MVDEWVRADTTCRPRRGVHAVAMSLLVVLAVVATACGEDGRNDEGAVAATEPSESIAGTTVRVLTHDSFNVSDEVLTAFEAQTGITVELVKGGDGVEVVNQAILTRDNPQGDVLFGIDNNLLTALYDANLFVPYESPVAGVRRPGCAARSRASGHTDRQGRRLSELRSRVLHRRAASQFHRRSTT